MKRFYLIRRVVFRPRYIPKIGWKIKQLLLEKARLGLRLKSKRQKQNLKELKFCIKVQLRLRLDVSPLKASQGMKITQALSIPLWLGHISNVESQINNQFKPLASSPNIQTFYSPTRAHILSSSCIANYITNNRSMHAFQ